MGYADIDEARLRHAELRDLFASHRADWAAGGDELRRVENLCREAAAAVSDPQCREEMGIVGDGGVLQTRISQIEILQWKRGTNQTDPIVHRIAASRSEGWGRHLGFDEMHSAFFHCVRERRRPPTSVRDCVDGTWLAIAAEESIWRGEMVDMGR